MDKGKIRNTTSEMKRELHIKEWTVNVAVCGWRESGRRIKPLKDRCQTTRNHTQKTEHFRGEKKKYTDCEYGETQTTNHPLQCPMIGHYCEKKKWLTPGKRQDAAAVAAFWMTEKEEGWSLPIPFKRYRHIAVTIPTRQWREPDTW